MQYLEFRLADKRGGDGSSGLRDGATARRGDETQSGIGGSDIMGFPKTRLGCSKSDA